MKRADVRNSFKKVLLTFETGKAFRNSMKFLVTGFLSLIIVLGVYFFTKNSSTLLFLVLPGTIFITSLEFYRRSRSAETNLKNIHNEEIISELKKFNGEELNRSSKY